MLLSLSVKPNSAHAENMSFHALNYANASKAPMTSLLQLKLLLMILMTQIQVMMTHFDKLIYLYFSLSTLIYYHFSFLCSSNCCIAILYCIVYQNDVFVLLQV